MAPSPLQSLNPSPLTDELLNGPLDKVTYFILNEVEGEDMTGESDPDKICDALMSKYPGCKVVLTLGKRGVVYNDGTTKEFHGTFKVDAVDTTAAGDTFTGYFLACILEGLRVDVALQKASKASAIAVTRKGASPSIPTREEVDSTELELR